MTQTKHGPFISWRWRLVVPLFALILSVAMCGAYAVALLLGGGLTVSQDNLLLESTRGLTNRANTLYREQVQAAQRIAFTLGVAESVFAGRIEGLQTSLENFAVVDEADSIILVNGAGAEVMGIQRVQTPEGEAFAVNVQTDLSSQQVVLEVLAGADASAGLLRTPEGVQLHVAVPLSIEGRLVGAVLVGKQLEAVLGELQSTAIADLTLYGAQQEIIDTTLTLDDRTLRDLQIDEEMYTRGLNALGGGVPLMSLGVGGTRYRVAYAPFSYGPTLLGVAASMLPDSAEFATAMGRQLTGLLAAMLSGTAVLVVFVGVSLFVGRVDRVRRTAEALTEGELTARTGLKPVDEVGAVGAALDAYADYTEQRQDALRQALRRQRRETEHLVSVFEAMQDGVIIQDLDGAVTMMNGAARKLIGTNTESLLGLTTVVTDALGPSLAPGVYALGDPQRVEVDGRMLSAQAAAVMSLANMRVGSVIVLRDITDFVKQEQQRERVLARIEQQVQQPLGTLARAAADSPLDVFAREITKRAVALQKLVVEMRELTDIDVHGLEQTQKPIPLDTLAWAVANEWRQIAQAASLKLVVVVEVRDLFVLGDNRRLRWAMGNLLDNAVKYTLPGGVVTLEITGHNSGYVHMRVRDNGVGIHEQELPHVFTRFYRGKPFAPDGQALRVPGMGQGLHVAQHIVRAHGGDVHIRSRVGMGTAVYFTLPLTAPVGIELPRLPVEGDIDGETVILPPDFDAYEL